VDGFGGECDVEILPKIGEKTGHKQVMIGEVELIHSCHEVDKVISGN
jgi:hypothetical protein